MQTNFLFFIALFFITTFMVFWFYQSKEELNFTYLLFHLLIPYIILSADISYYDLRKKKDKVKNEPHVLIEHGTIIRTQITCKKIPCYMRDSACRWFIVNKAKIFGSCVKHFWILVGVRKCRILIVLCK